MKSKTTIKLVSGMKSSPLGKTVGKKPVVRLKASSKGKTAPPPPKISRTHKPDGVEAGVDAADGTGPVIAAGDGRRVGTDAGTRFGIGGGAGDGAEALNTLLVSGAQFLMSLSKAIAPPSGVQDDNAAGDGPSATADGAPSLQKALQGMLGRDEATGKTYMKIPLRKRKR